MRLLGPSIFFLLALVGAGFARAAGVEEDKVKAAFLFQFVKFTAWDEAPPSRPFQICVLDDPGLFKNITQVVQGKNVGGHAVEAQEVSVRDDLNHCQLLYIGSREPAEQKKILARLPAGGVLTVSQSPDSATRGVIINFYLDEDKLRFEINLKAAKEAKLGFSSQFLKLARLIE